MVTLIKDFILKSPDDSSWINVAHSLTYAVQTLAGDSHNVTDNTGL